MLRELPYFKNEIEIFLSKVMFLIATKKCLLKNTWLFMKTGKERLYTISLRNVSIFWGEKALFAENSCLIWIKGLCCLYLISSTVANSYEWPMFHSFMCWNFSFIGRRYPDDEENKCFRDCLKIYWKSLELYTTQNYSGQKVVFLNEILLLDFIGTSHPKSCFLKQW